MAMAPLVVDMEGLTDPSERTAYLIDQHGLTQNAAIALQLAELGFSNSGIASKLDLTQGTIDKYQRQAEEQIGARVWESLPKDVTYDTFPPADDSQYAGDVINYSRKFREPQQERNEGSIDWDTLTGENITLDLSV